MTGVPTVLVVDDAPDIVRLLRDYLEHAGFAVLAATNGPDAIRLARSETVDLIVLDLGLPGRDGLDVTRDLRRDSAIPIVMLTARADESDKLVGLELGADDYVTKPFSPRELLARIRAVFRRRQAGEAPGKRSHLKAGGLEIDRERFEVSVTGRTVDLTPKEFELLATLVGAPGRVFRRDELLDLVWGHDGFVEPRTVDVHMARLRAKFLAAKVELPGVETVRGVGYRFREPEGRRS
jgi:two-component system alkaline phosphatase synthesis response regulator PhoP